MPDEKSEQLKTIWRICTKIATYFPELDKHDVYNYLYSDLKFTGLMDAVYRGNQLEEVKELDGWKLLMKLKEKKNIAANKNNGDNDFSQIKLAIWFINKIGSLERAKQVIEAASLALKSLDTDKT